MANQFDELDKELDRQSAEWLQSAMPDVFDALEVAVIRGASAEEIRARVLRRVGVDRTALAARCEACARYLESQKGK